MKHRDINLILGFLIASFFIGQLKMISQINPSNLLWNGCAYTVNGYKSPDTINCAATYYKLVFEDTFDSIALNNLKWQSYYPWSRSLHSKTSGTGWEREYYDDKNVSVKNGYLDLKTINDPGLRSPEMGTDNIPFNFTSGMVYSKFDFTFGKFEIRCKIPQLNGLFPAFWLYGHCGQEIDIFEFTNASATSDPAVDAGHVITTYHKVYDCSIPEDNQCDYGFTRSYDTDLSADFHTYAVEWNENKIVWFLDGKVLREVYRLWETSSPLTNNSLFTYANPIKSCEQMSPSKFYTIFYPFPSSDNRMNVIINTAVLKDRAGDSGALPQDFLIDYVRVFEEVPKAHKNSILTTPNFNVYPNPFSHSFQVSNEMLESSIDNVEVLNLMGELMPVNSVNTNGVFTIEMQDQKKGIYILKINCSGKYYFRKVVFN